ncbi:putative secreted beta-glucosidase [Ceratocystis fimbriata CBS 114723]|uniref:Putative secreted beta-glucosidase n=1 Tax=Ceratocystis fimbriata CBS 114723 TaxID=1035309 RepID=A0A2C5X5S7_9PEZI|nr:putative secreted beta-glucosidase [Ceratocystis fimbriata CBS 114723]
MKHAVVLSLVASVAEAASHGHRHMHKRGSLVERDGGVVWVPGPTHVVYVMGEETIAPDVAIKGLDNNDYYVKGESVPTFVPPPPPSSTTTPAPALSTSSSSTGAVFIEAYTKETSTTTTSTVPTTLSTSTSSAAAKASSAKAAPSSDSGSYSSGTGVDSKFPSGKIKCSDFPSEYGAIAIDFLGLDGWTGVQRTPEYSPSDSTIKKIDTAISGEGCTPNSFCSYACPLGYEKVQWPSAQGETKQSIGGLYCNKDGLLELSRDGYDTLCGRGAGGVYIQNDLKEVVSTCRTDYPGTESMTIPAIANPGAKIELTNTNSPTYYVWNDLPTTAQYYVNKKGYTQEDACLWNSPKDKGIPDYLQTTKSAGNWAPVNVGVGKAATGITFISIFPNYPTTTSKLDFNIEIIGDAEGDCKLENGVYSKAEGCTASLKEGGTAIIRFY